MKQRPTHLRMAAIAILIAVAFVAILLPAPLTAEDANYDPLRRLIAPPPAPAAPPPPPYDPMPYYAARGKHEPNDPMAALRNVPVAASNGSGEGLAGLPPGPNLEITVAICSRCHSTQLIAQQRLSPQRWEELWDWMIAEQRMPDFGPVVREQILTYLRTSLSTTPPTASPSIKP